MFVHLVHPVALRAHIFFLTPPILAGTKRGHSNRSRSRRTCLKKQHDAYTHAILNLARFSSITDNNAAKQPTATGSHLSKRLVFLCSFPNILDFPKWRLSGTGDECCLLGDAARPDSGQGASMTFGDPQMLRSPLLFLHGCEFYTLS